MMKLNPRDGLLYITRYSLYRIHMIYRIARYLFFQQFQTMLAQKAARGTGNTASIRNGTTRRYCHFYQGLFRSIKHPSDLG